MSMQQSTELIIFVTHVVAEDTFLKIWGQVDKNSATCVERMILPLIEQFAQSEGCVGPQSVNLRANALCCARFQNEGYYRARVINVRPDGMVVLQFIDYGNIDILPPQEVHLLESIHGSESLQACPPVAFEFTLMNVLPANGIWDDKIVESIKKTLWYNEYKILIHTVINNHRFIKLWYNNEDFSELLIKRHMAIRASLQDIFRPKCVQPPQAALMYQQPSKHLVSNSCTPVAPIQAMNPVHCEGNDIHGYQRNIPICCAAQQKHTMQTSVQEALVFKSRVLDVPSKHDVYVSFVEDGPHKFSVQLQSTSQILSMLMRDINSHPIEPLQEPPLPGSVCLGRYTQDKVLCRAVVMSVMENKCKLYYVDFGHTEVLPYTDIFQLPPHFINPKVLSIRFTLSGVHELKVTDEMKEYFKQIVSGKSLVLHVRSPEGPPLVQYGDLYDNGKNIKNILRQAFPTPSTMTPPASSFGYQEPQKILKGTEEIVHVSFVESCNKFFVQLDSGIKSLESIMNCLAEFCKTAPSLSLTQLRIGLPCAALYDNQWYRAQILSINTDNAKVLYVDYGNEEIVTLMSLRLIHDDLVKKLQAQAIKCILNGSESLPNTQEVSNQFELLILEKRLRLRVMDVSPDGIVVDLFEPEMMESIRSQLVNMIGTDQKFNNDLNCQNMENQYTTKISSKMNQSENTNKWQKRNHIDSWDETQIRNTDSERSKPRNWRNESNEAKQHESRGDKNYFHRMDPRNERYNRDEFPNKRNVKDKWENRTEFNDSSKSGKGAARDGRSKTGFQPKAHSSDKSWSDKDSDTSSKGSGKRGKGGDTRGSYSKRDGFSGRNHSRSSDKDSDGSFKGGKFSNDSYGSNKFKERKGQGYRLSQNKFDESNSVEEAQEYNSIRNSNGFQIPSHKIDLGTTKTCEVVFTNTPSDFFVQLSSDYSKLDTVMENIASIYENGGELMRHSKIRNGTYCIAQYSEDLKWYRAVIKCVEGNSATVQFVDYGNTETVEFDKIKDIQKEFLNLPIQAVHCKLLGVTDVVSEDKEIFEDKVNGKTLEAEFIIEENGVYGVLLREFVEDSNAANAFINEEFCKGADLLQIKEDALSRKKIVNNAKQPEKPDYAPLNTKWATISHTPETKKDVIITWFINPNNFYCQILDNENEFRTMMNNIQKAYVGRKPISNALQIGSSVIAIFADDGALYRAEVKELNKFGGHLIQYIDFGNSAIVDPLKIYAVENKFMRLPKQAVHCSLINITQQDDPSWSKVNAKEIDSCFNADKYECTFHDMQDNKYLISLSNNGNDVANMLVEKNLTSRVSTMKPDNFIQGDETTKTILQDIQRVDINLLSGQVLRVKVSSVESVSKFYVQLPSATECENMINTYMTDKDPKVMQRLSAHEICLGTGCLIYSNEVWKRAVICNHSQSKGFDVKFIDTGAYDEIFSDSVLALPGELSVMQNQALECSLKNIASSSEVDSILKERVEGKEAMIYVDEVDDNRLIVRIFDSLGNKINISEDSEERLSPICPMPILQSTYKVLVSYADSCDSVWLQRNIDYTLDQNLIETLDQYYATSGELAEPKVDLLCAVQSADSHWYRAKVLKHTETEVCVNFIDYGNNEDVSRDVVKVLDPRFYQPYQLAINVSLPVTLNCTVDEQVNILQSYLLNKELTAVFRNTNNKWIAELLDDGEKVSDKFQSLNATTQNETSETRQPQIHNMAVDCKYDVYVSHVDSPSQFWLQCVDDAESLSQKQDELQAQALQFPQVDGILEEGSLCVAVYTIDSLWYRAKVLDADEDITTVRFIDYGNTDVIDNKSGNIRQLLDSWKEIKEYAVKCRLDVIPANSEDWNATTCERFESLITSVESLQALIIANGTPKRVDLLIDNKSITEALVEEHHAVMIQAEEDLIDEIVDLELDPHSAFVSHINSPNEFWVQEEKSVGDLEVMSDRFMVADMFPKVDDIKENMLCVAKYPEDECWYRARVLSHTNNATRVIYIDYGNSAISTEIRAIPEDLANVPPLSRKCRLAMPEGITEWSDEACAEFTSLAADGATIFLLDVLKEEETSLVKLTLDGKNVADLLASLSEHYPPIAEERLSPLGEENSPNVFLCRVVSPEEFWIQAESSTADLNMMLEKMKAAPSFLPLDKLEVNIVCAAKFLDDGEWYRAKILSHSELGIEVQYIDYGNIAFTNEVRILPVDIMNIPALSKRCTLQKPDATSYWSLEASTQLEELSGSGLTMFQLEILDSSSDPISVKLSLNGKNVVDILLSHSENMSDDANKIEEEVNSCESNNMPETFENNEENENCNAVNESAMDETNDELQRDIGQDMINLTIKPEENDDTNDSMQNLKEEEPQDQQAAPDDEKNSVIELTVDEIVQNMEKDIINETEEEKNAFETTASDPEENKDSGNTTKDFQELEPKDELQSNECENQVQNKQADNTQQDEVILSNVEENLNAEENSTTDATNEEAIVSITVEQSVENLEKIKNDIIDSKVQIDNTETEICELDERIEICTNDVNLNTTEAKPELTDHPVEALSPESTENISSTDNLIEEVVAENSNNEETDLTEHPIEAVSPESTENISSTDNLIEEVVAENSNKEETDLTEHPTEAVSAESTRNDISTDNLIEEVVTENSNKEETDLTEHPIEAVSADDTKNNSSTDNLIAEVAATNSNKEETENSECAKVNTTQVETVLTEHPIEALSDESTQNEENAFESTATDLAENKDIEDITKDLQESETEHEPQSNGCENQVQELQSDCIQQDEIMLSNVEENLTTDVTNEEDKMSMNVEKGAENLDEIKNDIIDSKVQIINAEPERCESDEKIETCTNDTKVNITEVETDVADRPTEILADESTENSSLADNSIKEVVATNVSKEETDLTEHPIEVLADESTQNNSSTDNLIGEVRATNSNKEETDNSESAVNGDNKVNISVQDDKNDFDKKSMEEPLDVKFVEKRKECEVTDKQNVSLTSDTTVSVDPNEINSNKDALQSESVLETSE